ncbi:hypothetical protein [Rhodohalobacter sp.]|uniref:hypothetical protein n=1 Tax=Rhodohalobacter sp. TaxID=1974210 RepID=UPI002ACD72E0|nr:hypothetical protein [Rhodohalobacter sp.]MDZ7755180.1 hypothetical protein [Rhodohalobacter sp.]
MEGRFVERGEVKYCIKSIRKFAHWIRNICLVTDEQTPVWLDLSLSKKMNVHVIDHKTIFRNHLDCLPTFNSRAISPVMWKIIGLAEKFIYFNDDMFLISPVERKDFYNGEKVVMRGQRKQQDTLLRNKLKRALKKFLLFRKNITISSSKPHFIKSANLAGFKKKYFHRLHVPYAMKISTLKSFFDDNPSILRNHLVHKFRSNKNFITDSLFMHLALKEKKAAVRNDNDLAYIPTKVSFNELHTLGFLKKDGHRKKFLCIQNLESMQKSAPDIFAEFESYLESTIMRQ